MYSNTSVALPLPEAYGACPAAAPPVSSPMLGEPVTKTASSNTTRTSILEPAPYAPSAFVEETDSTLGGAVSIVMLLWPPVGGGLIGDGGCGSITTGGTHTGGTHTGGGSGGAVGPPAGAKPWNVTMRPKPP